MSHAPTRHALLRHRFGVPFSSLATTGRLLATLGLLLVPLGLLLVGCGGGADDGGPPVRFRLPVDNTGGRMLSEIVIGVDHDPDEYPSATYRCLSYDGEIALPYCYDGHDGTDFLLDGGFDAMDAGSAWVVAAADGVVLEVEDGHYDRCHSSLETGDIDCDGHPMIGNHVKLQHAGGVETWYWHFMKGSIVVSVGQEVACGEQLGLIGSSGRSAQPHVHFEVHDGEGAVVDPFAGSVTGPTSWWVEQDGPGGLPAETCQ